MRSIKRMSKSEISWLSGLLEGEGCFAIDYNRERKDGTRSVYPTIYVKMTDLDVLETAMNLTGLGKINKVKKQEPHHKDSWTWRIHGKASVDIMKRVLPFMHTRRSQKIEDILEKVTV